MNKSRETESAAMNNVPPSHLPIQVCIALLCRGKILLSSCNPRELPKGRLPDGASLVSAGEELAGRIGQTPRWKGLSHVIRSHSSGMLYCLVGECQDLARAVTGFQWQSLDVSIREPHRLERVTRHLLKGIRAGTVYPIPGEEAK